MSDMIRMTEFTILHVFRISSLFFLFFRENRFFFRPGGGMLGIFSVEGFPKLDHESAVNGYDTDERQFFRERQDNIDDADCHRDEVVPDDEGRKNKKNQKQNGDRNRRLFHSSGQRKIPAAAKGAFLLRRECNFFHGCLIQNRSLPSSPIRKL